jgi:hypothetical protein
MRKRMTQEQWFWQDLTGWSWNVVKAQRKRRLLIVQHSSQLLISIHRLLSFSLTQIRTSPQDTRNLGTIQQKPGKWQPEFSECSGLEKLKSIADMNGWNAWKHLKNMLCSTSRVHSNSWTETESGCMKCTRLSWRHSF